MERIIDEISDLASKQTRYSRSLKNPEQFLMALGATLGNANIAVLDSNMDNYYTALIEVAAMSIIALEHFEQHDNKGE